MGIIFSLMDKIVQGSEDDFFTNNETTVHIDDGVTGKFHLRFVIGTPKAVRFMLLLRCACMSYTTNQML